MALSNRINFRGGQSQPLGKYLYKNGVDNVALTGGLTKSNYTFYSGYSDNGYVNFESDAIYLNIPNGANASVAFGTTITVDVTDIASIVVRKHNQGGSAESQQVTTVDVSAISGQYYIAVVAWQDAQSSYVRFGVVLSTSTSYTWGNAVKATGVNDNNNYTMYIDEIELIRS